MFVTAPSDSCRCNTGPNSIRDEHEALLQLKSPLLRISCAAYSAGLAAILRPQHMLHMTRREFAAVNQNGFVELRLFATEVAQLRIQRREMWHNRAAIAKRKQPPYKLSIAASS